MLKLKKFIIGIQPASKMFRIPSINGLIIDDVLARRGTKPLGDNYYEEIATNQDQGTFGLQNKERSNLLRVDMSNVVLIKDAYESESNIHTDKTITEFTAIWNVVNGHLGMHNVRRIGVAAEYQIDHGEKNPNISAMDNLCKLPRPNHPGKFHLRFEDRRATKEGSAPDIHKSHFINVIYAYYDSELDADHPTPGFFNANIDYQKYYSPLLTTNIWDEVKIQARMFDQELKSFRKLLKEYNLVS